MVTFEKAKKMANDIYPVDQYTEYTDAYVFIAKKDSMTIGGNGPIVVMKNDGRVMNMTAYISISKGTFVKSGMLK